MIPVRLTRVAAATVAALQIAQIMEPMVSYALTAGTSQPEFASFTPVATGAVVNDFTGAFTYGLPLLTVPGPSGSSFPVTLNYASGISPEDEASWVGLGWSLSAGAISRSIRGFPDDAKGVSVRTWNKRPANVTITAKGATDIEIASQQVRLGVGAALRYNNYRGFSIISEFDIRGFGITLGLRNDAQDGSTWSASINPWLAYASVAGSDDKGKSEEEKMRSQQENNGLARMSGALTSNLLTSAAAAARPSSVDPGWGVFFTLGVGFTTEPLLPVGPRERAVGTFAYNATTERYDVSRYGYLHLASAPEQAQTDYTTEKLAPFSTRDKFLGIPHLLPDGYGVTAPGLVGTFRPFRGSVGTVSPPKVSNSIAMFHAEAVFHAGNRVGPGVRAGAGAITTTMERWGTPDTNYLFAKAPRTSTHEPVFFRMVQDPGGTFLPLTSTQPKPAAIAGDPEAQSTGLSSLVNGGARVGRATFIGYHTNDEMMRATTAFPKGQAPRSVYYLSETRSQAHRSFVDRSDTANGFQSQIGEFYAKTPGGMRYVFGLPVYARGECDLQYGVDDVRPSELDSSHILFRSIDSTADRVIGEVRPAPYATTYLLTELTTPDYRDLTYDGPTDDDLGGYVRFDYARTAGTNRKSTIASNSPWFKWRAPYRGLLYHANSMSDDGDDYASASWGEKEIYHLGSIETKTHVALFITNIGSVYKGLEHDGSGHERQDGFGAIRDELTASGSRTATTANDPYWKNDQVRLEKIELYAKDSAGMPGKLLQTVHFQYDYSLCPNVPNGKPDGEGGTSGKLTLRKVWSEYGGVVQPRVSPFVFGYQYRDSSFYAQHMRDRYRGITRFGYRYSASAQNPAYSIFSSDAWGQYRSGGGADEMHQFPWVRQTDTTTDPAPWSLKWIRLPSGGEIQVQYERNRYRFVQDRTPMAMVRMVDDNGEESPEEDRFSVDVESDLGIDTDAALDSLAEEARNLFITENEKLFFSCVYSLNPSMSPGIDQCTSERITGYVRVTGVSKATIGGKRCLTFTVGTNNNNAYAFPQEVARDFAKKHRVRSSGSGVMCRSERTNWTASTTEAALSGLTWLLGAVTGDLAPELIGELLPNLPLAYPHSYLRIPLSRPKLGGGTRVKRLLTFDPGLQPSASALYGTEYAYVDEKGACSGVASNEPPSGREENALVHEISRQDDQTFWNRVMSGPDRLQTEGPVGEFLLPGPSVGYATVVARSIHSGPTAPGFVVNRFWTYRDYPVTGYVRTDPTDSSKILPVQMSSINRSEFNPPGFYGPVSYSTSRIRLTQAFRFVQTSMHGRPRSVTTYVGDPDDAETWGKTAETEYLYAAPGEEVDVYAGINQTSLGLPGVEREAVMESRAVSNTVDDGYAELDPDIFLFGLGIPSFTFGFGFSISEEFLGTHVTSEVIRYPAIVKEVRTYADGVERTVAQTSFDPQSGAATVTEKKDGYDGKNLPQSASHVGRYWAQTIPYWGVFAQAATNHGLVLTSGNEYRVERRVQSEDSVYLNIRGLKPGVLTRVESLLVPGDVVELRLKNDTTKLLGIYSVSDVKVPRVWLQPLSVLKQKSGTTDEVVLSVLRSGYANAPAVPAGAVVSYGQLGNPFHIAP